MPQKFDQCLTPNNDNYLVNNNSSLIPDDNIQTIPISIYKSNILDKDQTKVNLLKQSIASTKIYKKSTIKTDQPPNSKIQEKKQIIANKQKIKIKFNQI